MSTPSSVADVGEHALIARVRERVPPPPAWVAIGLGDDAAVVEPARNLLEVATTDALVEGVHFDRAFTPPRAIGHRALAVNLSDLAAMGASPRSALLSLVLPPDLLARGFRGDRRRLHGARRRAPAWRSSAATSRARRAR